MSPFVDTNILVAAVTTDTDRSDDAVNLLNEIEDGYTSILNVMEVRSVLAKKKGFDRDRIQKIVNRITSTLTITFPDASDVVAANRQQAESLLYPMDALILAAAESVDQPLITFDTELLAHGAIEPAELLEDFT